MSIYRFVLRNPGRQVEELGCITLPDDGEAVAFGEAVVREITADSSAPSEGLVMEVTDGERIVGRIEPE